MKIITLNIETERDPNARMPQNLIDPPEFPPISEPEYKLGALKDPVKIEAKKAEQLARYILAQETKCEAITAEWEAKRAKWEDTCALHATRGRILCAGVITPDGNTEVMHGDSREITFQCVEWLSAAKDGGWIVSGHNILGFDLPFLYQRARIYDIPTYRIYRPMEKWDKWAFPILDTMLVWAAGRRDACASLGDISEAMGFGERVGNGKDFARLYHGTTEERELALSHLTTGLTQCRKIAERML